MINILASLPSHVVFKLNFVSRSVSFDNFELNFPYLVAKACISSSCSFNNIKKKEKRKDKQSGSYLICSNSRVIQTFSFFLFLFFKYHLEVDFIIVDFIVIVL